MTIGERLELFIHTCFDSQIAFSKEVDIDATYLNRIIHNKNTPGTELLIKFIEIGLSIDWLLKGIGSMFSNNQAGQELKKNITAKDQFNKLSPSERLRRWISENYDNLENLCNIFNIDYIQAYKIAYESSVPGVSFLSDLNNAGCNTEWVLSGNGSPYENNPVGTILKLKKFGFENLPIQSNEIKFEDVQINEIKTSQDLYYLIKKVVSNELDRRNKNEDYIYNTDNDSA
ncbi:MAG: XRE family transcriptional regulator [Bacteroidetes bacterium]|nr:MAG: XRE family transcriptional regulator [Bacteroidota bacterium]